MNRKLVELGKQAEAAAQHNDAKAGMEAAGAALQVMGEAMAAQSGTTGN